MATNSALDRLLSDQANGRRRWKVGPRDSEVRRGMREASRRGRITAAQRRDYEEMRRREAMPWLLRHAAKLRIPAIVLLTLVAMVVGLLVFQALLTALMVAVMPLVSRGWVPLLLAVGLWLLWPRPRRRRRR